MAAIAGPTQEVSGAIHKVQIELPDFLNNRVSFVSGVSNNSGLVISASDQLVPLTKTYSREQIGIS